MRSTGSEKRQMRARRPTDFAAIHTRSGGAERQSEVVPRSPMPPRQNDHGPNKNRRGSAVRLSVVIAFALVAAACAGSADVSATSAAPDTSSSPTTTAVTSTTTVTTTMVPVTSMPATTTTTTTVPDLVDADELAKALATAERWDGGTLSNDLARCIADNSLGLVAIDAAVAVLATNYGDIQASLLAAAEYEMSSESRGALFEAVSQCPDAGVLVPVMTAVAAR